MGPYDLKGMFVYEGMRYPLEANLLIDRDGFFETVVHDRLYSSQYYLFGRMTPETDHHVLRFVRSPHQQHRDGLFFSLYSDSLDEDIMRFFGGWHVLPEEKAQLFQFPLPWREAELEAFSCYTKEIDPQGIAGLYLLERTQTKYL